MGVVDPSARSHRSNPVDTHDAERLWSSQRSSSRGCDHEPIDALERVLHRPCWLPVPGFALHLALGELGTLMTTGQRVTPAKGLSEGYAFQYQTLEPALGDHGTGINEYRTGSGRSLDTVNCRNRAHEL